MELGKHSDILEGVSKDLEKVLKKLVGGLVESHLEGWGERYANKSEDSIREDLYINHDPSIEIENVIECLGRELDFGESEVIEEYFNEHVLDVLIE